MLQIQGSVVDVWQDKLVFFCKPSLYSQPFYAVVPQESVDAAEPDWFDFDGAICTAPTQDVLQQRFEALLNG